jgi:hypothetical protein
MSDMFKAAALGALIIVGFAIAPALHAEQPPSSPRQNPATMGGTHGNGMTMGGGMMGNYRQPRSTAENDGGSGMAMMGRMDQMPTHCDSMMQGRDQPPNSQFRRPLEAPPNE